MATTFRKTGLSFVGDRPWGTHFCHFYETKADLLDTLVPYFKTGLENNEFCVWVISEPLTEEEVRYALRLAVPDLAHSVVDRSLEILLAREWYLTEGMFDFQRVLNGWNDKLDHAMVRGYDGMRVSGNTVWLEKKDWKDFSAYEKELNESIIHQPMTALCTYALADSGAAEILDVARTHQFVIARRGGDWEMIEIPELKQAKAEIQRLNTELEQRVSERTSQLTAVNEALRNEMNERQHTEEERLKLASLVENSTDFIGIAALEGQVLFVNPAGQKMVGLDGDERVRATRILDYVVEEERARVQQHVLPAVLRDGHWEGEIRLRHFQTGAAIPMLQHIFSIKEQGSDRPVALATVSRDMTERKRAEETLYRTQTELAHVTRVLTMGALTASIAHEVNQPLAAVITNGNACLRWLARETPDLDEARAAVERMIRDSNRAHEVIQRIRALVQKTDPQKAWLDINTVIHEVIALVQSEVHQNRVWLRTALSATLPPVLGDRVQVQQVLLNLLLNGMEAMRAVTDRPRELLISSQRHASDAVLVAVQDSGSGLDPESLDRLFDAFFTTRPGGMGMGLAISHSIITAHGGRLWASPNAGPGATLQFTLPTGGERVS
jgi:PAS domain S-box-containing protein